MIRLLHRLIGYDDGHVIILYITSEKEESEEDPTNLLFVSLVHISILYYSFL